MSVTSPVTTGHWKRKTWHWHGIATFATSSSIDWYLARCVFFFFFFFCVSSNSWCLICVLLNGDNECLRKFKWIQYWLSITQTFVAPSSYLNVRVIEIIFTLKSFSKINAKKTWPILSIYIFKSRQCGHSSSNYFIAWLSPILGFLKKIRIGSDVVESKSKPYGEWVLHMVY